MKKIFETTKYTKYTKYTKILLVCFVYFVVNSLVAATMLNYMSGTNEVYTAAETDAAIVRLAPAPGDYAAVSNAAMNAATQGDLTSATNALVAAFERDYVEEETYSKIVQAAERAAYAYEAYAAQEAFVAYELGPIRGDSGEYRHYDDIFSQLDAATSTNAAQTAALAGKASTNDVALTPVFSEWVLNPPSSWLIVWWADEIGLWVLGPDVGGSNVALPDDTETGPDVLQLTFHEGEYTATRSLLGYVLGSQTNKVLSSTNDLARASDLAAVRSVADAAASTNAAQTAALSQQSQSLSTLSSQVSAIGAHLNAEDARFVSTNYNSATHMPEAYVEVKITENGVSSWLTVWREMTRWDWFLGIYTNQYAELSAALANKGEREYAFYDGVTGEPAPDGFFWIAQPRVAVAAGMSYQRYVDTGGAVWVLESNGMVADVNGTTNGFFRISDDEGNTQFEIVKGSSRIVVAAPGAMTHESVMGVTHWFTTYAVTNAASAPVAMFCRDIGSQEWHAETDGDCPCNVSWTNPESGVYVCEWWAKGTEPRMFMKAKYGQGTESRIVQSAPVEMQYIVINGVKYTLGTATISGNTVLTLSPAAP